MKFHYFTLVLCLFIACTEANKSLQLNELKEKIDLELSALEGDFAIAYQDINYPEQQILINVDERFHAASTMKTPVLIELYKRAENTDLDLSDSILIKTEFKSIVDGSPFSMEVTEDSEKDLYRNLNKNTTFYKLAYEMITRSSNLATNILIDYLDAKKVTSTMRDLGADSINVLRGVEDLKAYRQGLSNTTTARDLLVIFEHLSSDTLISKEANKEMIEILKDQVYNDMISAKLPEGTEVAHKTGWITNVHHDSGIVYTSKDEGYILIFLSKNAPDREAVLEAAANISSMIYNYTVSGYEN
ncbi:MAG: serine hydrolase [Balneola sp.]|nr:serine hydrolase [Balneola sp.]